MTMSGSRKENKAVPSKLKSIFAIKTSHFAEAKFIEITVQIPDKTLLRNDS